MPVERREKRRIWVRAWYAVEVGDSWVEWRKAWERATSEWREASRLPVDAPVPEDAIHVELVDGKPALVFEAEHAEDDDGPERPDLAEAEEPESPWMEHHYGPAVTEPEMGAEVTAAPPGEELEPAEPEPAVDASEEERGGPDQAQAGFVGGVSADPEPGPDPELKPTGEACEPAGEPKADIADLASTYSGRIGWRGRLRNGGGRNG